MKIIGLTGLSGSGKGKVSEIMAKYGAFIIDCDKIAHNNMLPTGVAYNEILSAFGKDILNEDNTVNRKALGAIVFTNTKKLALLNKITHKYITEVIENTISSNRDKKCIVIDAPLLLDAGLERLCDSVWVVYAPFDIRLKRVMSRDNIDRENALMRFENQKSFDEIKTFADVIIDNRADENELEKAVVYEMNKMNLCESCK